VKSVSHQRLIPARLETDASRETVTRALGRPHLAARTWPPALGRPHLAARTWPSCPRKRASSWLSRYHALALLDASSSEDARLCGHDGINRFSQRLTDSRGSKNVIFRQLFFYPACLHPSSAQKKNCFSTFFFEKKN
jgi:hypothetical protein